MRSDSFKGKMAGMCANMSDLLRALSKSSSYDTDWL